MRGKAVIAGQRAGLCRITPAYAGKSPHHAGTEPDGGDHPRLCGEKFFKDSNCKEILGSPPPMRGKGQKNTDAVRPYRITPAYAGKRER